MIGHGLASTAQIAERSSDCSSANPILRLLQLACPTSSLASDRALTRAALGRKADQPRKQNRDLNESPKKLSRETIVLFIFLIFERFSSGGLRLQWNATKLAS